MSDDSATSGGILVALGIIIALGGVFFFTLFSDHSPSSVTANSSNISAKQ